MALLLPSEDRGVLFDRWYWRKGERCARVRTLQPGWWIGWNKYSNGPILVMEKYLIRRTRKHLHQVRKEMEFYGLHTGRRITSNRTTQFVTPSSVSGNRPWRSRSPNLSRTWYSSASLQNRWGTAISCLYLNSRHFLSLNVLFIGIGVVFSDDETRNPVALYSLLDQIARTGGGAFSI